MNKQLSQINSLVDLLIKFDMDANQPLKIRQALYLATIDMINNPDIYGEVLRIAIEINKNVISDDNFNIKVNNFDFADYAFQLCEYLSVDD